MQSDTYCYKTSADDDLNRFVCECHVKQNVIWKQITVLASKCSKTKQYY